MRCEGFYDRARNPPHPVAVVRIENPVTGKSLEERFHIDTGFDGALLLTREVWEKLNLELALVDEEVYALHGGFLPVRLSTALVQVYLCGYRLGLLKARLHPFMSRPLLGRELLNRFYAHLDAPGERVLLEGW